MTIIISFLICAVLNELNILTASTESLLQEVLRQRAESSESTKDEFPVLSLSLGLEDGHLEVIVSKLEKLRPSAGRYPNKMTLTATLVPGDLADKRKSQEIQGGSKTVNLDPEVRFDFITDTRKWEDDVFLTINLCGKWKRMQRSQLIGSVVIRVDPGKKFGMELRYRLHTTWGDEDLAERRELEWRSRTDPMAKDFVARQCPVSPTNINGDALCEDINAVMLG